MAKKTDQELQTELQDVIKKHNEAANTVQECKTMAIQLQAILEDRKPEQTVNQPS